MRAWLKVSWFYFVLLAFVGLLLRSFPFTNAADFFEFRNLVHAHSHIAILAWIYNAVFLLVYKNFLTEIGMRSRTYLGLLIRVYQLIVVLMFIAFVLQGYGLYSILFSTLQMFITFLLLTAVYKSGARLSFGIHISTTLLVVSSILPLFLGMVKALEVSDELAELIINAYLYLQISGFLYFALLSIVFKRYAIIEGDKQKFWLKVLLATVLCSGIISLKLVSTIHFKVFIFLVSSVQVLALWKLLKAQLKQETLLKWIFTVLVLKSLLQFVFVLPNAVDWLSNRYLVLSYLHGLLLFVFSFTFWLFFIKENWMQQKPFLLFVYLKGTLGTVLVLCLLGFGVQIPFVNEFLFVFAALLFLPILGGYFTLNESSQK